MVMMMMISSDEKLVDKEQSYQDGRH